MKKLPMCQKGKQSRMARSSGGSRSRSKSRAAHKEGGRQRQRRPLDAVRRVSGPVSVHAFDVPTLGGGAPNRLYVFGDTHFSYDHQCEACTPEHACTGIVEALRAQAVHARETGTTLDVFLEMPYVAPRGPLRASVVGRLDRAMRADAAPGKAVLKLLGANPGYIGIFSLLYRAFARDLYPEEAGGDARRRGGQDGPGAVRFHHSDARFEPNVQRVMHLAPARFHEGVSTPEHLRQLLHAVLFGKDWPRDLGALYGARAAARMLQRDTLSGPKRATLKVAKQYARLEEGSPDVARAVRAHLEERAEAVVSLFRDVVGLARGVAAIHALSAKTQEGDDYSAGLVLDLHRLFLGGFYVTAFRTAVMLAMEPLPMDAYLVCRMLRFLTQRADTAGGTTVVYVGDAHAEQYVRLLTHHMGLKAVVCKKAARRAGTSSADRCVAMSACGDAGRSGTSP